MFLNMFQILYVYCEVSFFYKVDNKCIPVHISFDVFTIGTSIYQINVSSINAEILAVCFKFTLIRDNNYSLSDQTETGKEPCGV